MLNSKMLNFNTFVPLCRKTRSSSTFFKFGMGKTNQSFKFNIFCYVSCRLSSGSRTPIGFARYDEIVLLFKGQAI